MLAVYELSSIFRRERNVILADVDLLHTFEPVLLPHHDHHLPLGAGDLSNHKAHENRRSPVTST